MVNCQAIATSQQKRVLRTAFTRFLYKKIYEVILYLYKTIKCRRIFVKDILGGQEFDKENIYQMQIHSSIY
jgi:hypothetical protein